MANDNRNLPATHDDESRRSVRLHDNGLRAGNLIDGAISRLDERQVQALGFKAAEAALELQKRQTQQNIDYVTGKKVAEDHIDTWNTLDRNGRTTRQRLTTDIETGAGRMRIVSESGACFVATAAYGDCQHPDVEFLRWYRDNVLVTSSTGRAFTRAYWKVGPHLAVLVSPYPKVRAAVRAFLGRLVLTLRKRHGRSV